MVNKEKSEGLDIEIVRAVLTEIIGKVSELDGRYIKRYVMSKSVIVGFTTIMKKNNEKHEVDTTLIHEASVRTTKYL